MSALLAEFGTRPRSFRGVAKHNGTGMDTIEHRVREFLHENFPSPEGADELKDDQSLFEAGILDSMGVLALVTWLEPEFGIVVDDDDVVPENIDGVRNLVRYVRRKRAEAGLGA